jgi:penicillin-binding protein 2
VNDADLKTYASEKYKTGDDIGKTGVERSFESELRGTPGVDKVQVDSRGRAVDTITEKKPRSGNDVQLTVDGDVQKIALESLQQGIDRARSIVSPDTGNYYDPTGGAVVVLDARTGSVVAMASSPNYDPNAFISHTADAYLKDPNHPLLDRATSGYAPGSTFKLVTSVAMLKSGLEPDGAGFTYYDPGYFDFGNDQRLYNAGHVELGSVNLPRALTVSSDVYFYKLGNDFWVQYRNEGQAAGHTGDLAGDEIPSSQHPVGDAIQHTAADFGLGTRTGIGFGEDTGRIPDYAYRAEANKNSADRFSRTWLRGDSANLAVGQGDVLVTPLQLALAYATLGNGGTLNTPRVASSVRASAATRTDGQLGAVDHTNDQQVRNKVDLILAGLDGAVNSGEGTAYGAFADYQGGYHVVGKTGTAQINGQDDTAWFVSILNPENNPNQPQYVVLAMVEHGGFGAAVAAPVARRVINYLTDPTVVPAPVSVAPPTKKEQSF